MATSGKKIKKVKRKAVPLQDFLAENGGDKVITAQITKVVAPASWVDECDEDEIEYNRPLQAFSLPTAPRASRAMDDVPEQAPFIAHLSNLPFDVDDEDLYDFFIEQEVESLRLPREDGGGRSRGFGYIEFKSRNDLIAALMMPDPHIRNRRIRIDVSTESDQKRGSGGRYGRDSGFGDTSNWRKDGAGGGGGGMGGRDDEGRGRSYGMNRDRPEREWPAAGDEGGNWRDNMKKRSDSPPQRSAGGEGGGMRRGYGGDRDRDGGDRYGGGGGGESRDRYMGRGSGGRYESDRPVARSENEPAERPKLVLQKRTLPLPEIVQVPQDGETAGADADNADGKTEKPADEERVLAVPVPAADIFGEAKPVDTAARERQLEERLERERVAREEAAEAARAERAANAEAARAAAAIVAAEAATTENGAEKAADSGVATSPSSDGGEHAVKEDGDGSPVAVAPAPVTSWRRRAADDEANEEGGRGQSPDRRTGGGGGRREYNTARRDNNNDRDGYNQRRGGDYNQRDNRGRNNDGYNSRAGGRDAQREDKPLRRNENAQQQESGDENQAPREPQEPRMPKYKEPANIKLATTNKFEGLDDEGSD